MKRNIITSLLLALIISSFNLQATTITNNHENIFRTSELPAATIKEEYCSKQMLSSIQPKTTKTTSDSSQRSIYKNNLKVTVLSLFSGSTKLTYERSITPNRSIEITGGVIGWGGDRLNNNNSKGGLCRFTYKFIFHSLGLKNHSLQGFYLKPELAFSSFSYDSKESQERLYNNRLAVMGCLGYQIVFQRFVFDIFGGLGAGIGDENDYNYYHGFIALPKGTPTAFTAGFKLGVAF